MANLEELKALALACGFDHVGDLDARTIALRTEVREACEVNKCQHYGKNWVCPPACGTLDECRGKIGKFSWGLILQSTGELEDSFDFEGIMELGHRHREAFHAFADQVKKQYPNALLLGDGACRNCRVCTYPDEPCRFPERQFSAMEAFGMLVSEVCQLNRIPYYYGPGTLTLVGCVLVE